MCETGPGDTDSPLGIAVELVAGAEQMQRRAQSNRSPEKVLFLESYADLLEAYAAWVVAQAQAGILPAAEIARLASFPLELARTNLPERNNTA